MLETYNFENKESGYIRIYSDYDIPKNLKDFLFENSINIRINSKEANLSISLNGDFITIEYLKEIIFRVFNHPFNYKQILKFLTNFKASKTEILFYENLQKKFHFSQKRYFKKSTLLNDEIWISETINELNKIITQTYNLSSVLEQLLETQFFKKFSSFFCFFHQKGSKHANVIGSKWRNDKFNKKIKTQDFNKIFTLVKKSKNKFFSSDVSNHKILEFNGTFLAQEHSSQKFNLILLATREDFLQFKKNEIDFFQIASNLLEPHLFKLIDKDYTINSIAELRSCISYFPATTLIKDLKSNETIQNSNLMSEKKSENIFFSKTSSKGIELTIFNSPLLDEFSFDLFHHQRISLLGDLLNTLKHELSNPLFGLKLSTDLCLNLASKDDDQFFLNEIKKNVERCHLIIENFSAIYFTSSNKEEISLKKVLSETFSISKSEIRDINLTIKYVNCTENDILMQPLLYLLQIIFNLIINASQAIKSEQTKGKIEIQIEKMNNDYSISISDSGPGILEFNKDHLFTPFFTTKKNGTGLGLVLSKNLANKMGGDLTYEPIQNSPFKSTFKLIIPSK